jgi:hypothetical protein
MLLPSRMVIMTGILVEERAHQYPFAGRRFGCHRRQGDGPMSRDLATSRWLSANKFLPIDLKGPSIALEPAPAVVEPAKEEAHLIMARLMRVFLARRPARP